MSGNVFTAASADVAEDAVLGDGTKVWHLSLIHI